ncbi:MAG: hypothetical protein HRU13_12360 [Phycisphaerales bacterium]|nr:hypothetical protein [Phycisphaerales bacterium]
MRPISGNATAVFGVDVAKTQDYTVVFGIDDAGDCSYFDRWQGLDWGPTGDRIAAAIGDTPTLVDQTGVGSAPVDRLKETHSNVEGFLFTNTTKQELMGNLAVEIQNDRAGIPDNEVRQELDVFEYQTTKTGRVSYSAPEGLHDDCVCAMALAHEMKRRYVPVHIIGGDLPHKEATTWAEAREDIDFGFDN